MNPSNSSCLPVVGLNASCRHYSEFEILSGETGVYDTCHIDSVNEPFECIDYHICFGNKNITTIMLLVQKCSYPISPRDPSQVSELVKYLKANISSDYTQFLERYHNLVEIGSITTICPSNDQGNLY